MYMITEEDQCRRLVVQGAVLCHDAYGLPDQQAEQEVAGRQSIRASSATSPYGIALLAFGHPATHAPQSKREAYDRTALHHQMRYG